MRACPASRLAAPRGADRAERGRGGRAEGGEEGGRVRLQRGVRPCEEDGLEGGEECDLQPWAAARRGGVPQQRREERLRARTAGREGRWGSRAGRVGGEGVGGRKRVGSWARAEGSEPPRRRAAVR